MSSKYQKNCANILVALLLTILAFLCNLQVLDGLCLTSDLPKGVLISRSCRRHFREICHARCIAHDSVIWKKLVMCMSYGKWSPLPTCQTTHTLELIRCNRKTDLSQENMAACVKIKITMPRAVATPKAICPDILRLFVKFGSCQKKPGTDCAVTCRNGYFILMCLVKNRLPGDCGSPAPSLCPKLKYVKLVNCSRIQGVTCKILCPNGKIAYEETFCLPSYEWAPLPSCDFRSQCKKQKLPEKLYFLSHTCKNSKALYCRVGCKVKVFSPTSLRTSQEVVFINDIHCSSSGEWKGLPNCKRAEKIFWDERIKKGQCEKPKLDKHSRIKGSCSYLEGSVCQYKCEKGFSSKGNHTIRCLKKKWHGFYKCEPLPCPKLPEIYELKNNCPLVTHSVCETGCRVGELIGKSKIFCYPSGHWSALPLCVPYRTCPGKISSQIAFVTKCLFKEGEKCQVRCQGKLLLEGSHFVICRKGKWRDIPDCFLESKNPYKAEGVKCHFPPQLNGNLKLFGLCKPVVGMSCDISCRDDSALMVGPNATTCLPPGLWTFVKPCTGGKSYCSAPKFHHILIMEYCSGKEIGSSCQVRCKHRPSIKFSIICTKKVTWSTPPNCTCPDPVLKEGIELKENCRSKQVGQKCNIRCKRGFTMVGAGIITCNTVLQWSPLPVCKKNICQKPKLTSVLMFKEDCSAIQSGKKCSIECKEGGKILYHSKITCINGKTWTKLPSCACPPPALDEDLKTKNSCNENHTGQKCLVSCRGSLFLLGKNYIVCQNNTVWSSAPRCKRKLCHKPILTDILIFDEDCSSKQPGERCRMACKNLGSLVGPTIIVCSNSTRWSPLPTCSCPPPTLPNFLKAKENCSRKLPGESCPLSCADKLKVEGNATIKCQDDGHWSSLPRCKENICTKKRLPRYLVHSTDCTAIPPGEKCFLECKEGGKIEGNDFIICVGGSQWTALPRCRCPDPKLSYYLSTTVNCKRKRIGEKCYLRCNERHQLKGNNFITCQNNTIWSPLPKCTRNLCSKQKLPSFLIYAEDCETKIPGELCRLECVEGGAMIGSSNITCVNGTKWSSLPNCTCPPPNLNERLISTENCSKKLIGQKCVLKCIDNFSFSGENFTKCLSNTRWSPLPMCTINFCTRPNLPNELSCAEDCTSKVPGESCLLECTGEGEIVGSNKITCINTTKWETFPKCTCPAPDLEEDLSTIDDCRKKLIGENCRVTCKGTLELLGSNLITCQQNSLWSSPPRCKRLTCTKPTLNSIVSFDEDCTSKSVNEKCELECSEGGQIVGSKFITCMKKGHDFYWSVLPQCTCGDPFLSEELKLLEKCHFMKPGDSCKVNCTDRSTTILGGNIIRCQNNTKWTHLPKCVLNICMKPKLPDILEIQEDCSSKIVGESCRLKCRNGGILRNVSQISCSESRTWTPLPNCTCYTIALSEGVKLLENCSAKLPGETCRAACISPLFKMNRQGPLICKNDSKWSFQPRCTKVICSQPTLPEYLVFNGRCSNTSIGSVCSINCAEKGRLTGNNFIKCTNGSLWSNFPDCSCSKPLLPKTLVSTHNCDFIKRGERCTIKCEDGLKINGNDFILCQNNTKWSSLPKCVYNLCPAPVLKNGIVKLKEDCSKKTVADKCELNCVHGGTIIGNKYIECRNNFQWTTDLPDCTCKTPSFTESVQFAANCSFKKSERCDVSCKEGYKLIGQPYIICQNNLSWTSLPKCNIIECGIPILRSPVLKFSVNCINKTYDAICRLDCKEGGQILGENFIKCKKTGTWSSLPDCTCPSPAFSNGLGAKTNCTSVKRGEKCPVECEKNFRLLGNDFILCQNDSKWSQKPLCNKRVCPRPVISSAISFLNGNCSGMLVGDQCRVRCRFGGRLLANEPAKCLLNETWSSFPDCTCNPPTLTSDIEFKENCTFKRKKDKCAVACKEGSKHTAIQYITCENYTKWSTLPTCRKAMCPLPFLNFLKMEEDCSQKTAEEVCLVSCKENGRLIGRAFMKCLKNMTWSSIPDCSCAPPILNADLKTKEDCSFKKRGENCSLQCKNDKLRIQGSGYILCQNSTKWTELPNCISLHCPTPILDRGILMLKENCSKKTVGEECQVHCTNGGMVLGHDLLICFSNQTWSSFPDCTCPAPKLRANMEIIGNCNFNKNDKCVVMCTEGARTLQDINSQNIICQNNATWSALLNCTKVLCEIPVPRVIAFNRSCIVEGPESYGTGSCEVYCAENGMLIGKKQVRCLNNRTWSELPDCSCPPPVLPRNLIVSYDCSFVRRGGLCHLGCKGENLFAPKNSFITCQNNTKWSSLPKCKAYCREPDFTEASVTSENLCNDLEIGGRCFLTCKFHGTIIGSNYTMCRSNYTWSPFPECTCYDLAKLIPLGLTIVGNKKCDQKRIGEYCTVECRGKVILVESLNCKKNAKWNHIPKCVTLYCPSPPELDTKKFGIVESENDCSLKTLYKFCRVYCRNGGIPMVRKRIYKGIQCLEGLVWHNDADCTCPPLTLNADFDFLEDCSAKEIGEYCLLRCKGDLHISKSYIVCNENGVWDPLPVCSTPFCADPNLANSNIYQLAEDDCTEKRFGETCMIDCRKGNEKRLRNYWIICNDDRTWSSYPECPCPRPILGIHAVELQDCSYILPEGYCLVGCNEGFISNNHFMKCQPGSKWDVSPLCFPRVCPLPALPEVIFDFPEDCTNKKVGEDCYLVCKGGGSAGTNRILCQSDLSWSVLPTCNCPLPILNQYLQMQEDCSKKKPNEKCFIRCINVFELQKNYITCQENAQWEALPSCVSLLCQPPVLPGFLAFAEDCIPKSLGDTCLLRCVVGGNMLGSDRIVCTENSIWSRLPSCACPVPVLGVYMEMTEDCTKNTPDKRCFFRCTNGHHLPKNYITCQENRQWEALPPCVSLVCQPPVLPEGVLQFEEDCTAKPIGDKCRLRCVGGGNIVGSDEIVCSENLIWSQIPHCACPVPILDTYLEMLEDCTQKTPNERCLLRCLNGYDFQKGFIFCQENRQWEPLPRCVSLVCQSPILPNGVLAFAEDCTAKPLGDTCLLRCVGGGNIMGSDRIVCTENLIWSQIPHCACPVPILDAYLEMLEDCTKKTPNERCLLRCLNGYELQKGFIFCQENWQWEPLPPCVSLVCQPPVLPERVLQFEEDCTAKPLGDTCRLRCVGGGNIVGSDRISCTENLIWSQLPSCACPVPALDAYLEMMEDCTQKTPNERCLLRCLNGYDLPKSFIFCQENRQWEPLPPCVSLVCQPPVFPEGVLAFAEDCTAKTLGDTCLLRCVIGGNMLGSDRISCTENLIWSQLPSCACPVPALDAYLEMMEDCTQKTPNERCLLRCLNGYDLPKSFIFCQENRQWEPLPPCVSMVCQPPVLPEGVLAFAEDCTAKPLGDTCLLRCVGGGYIVGSDRIACTENLIWSQLPSCACPVPTLDTFLEMMEDCTKKTPNERCLLRCLNGYYLPKGFILCQENRQWEPLPPCVSMVCQPPVLPEGVLAFAEDCTAKPLGDTCLLRCVGGGYIVGSDRIVCSENLIWTQLPSCACPVPALDTNLEMMEDCTKKTPNERCLLRCLNGYDLPKGFIFCQENRQWEPLPPCVSLVCQSPVLPERVLQFEEDCTAKPLGDTCRLRCVGGGNIVGSNRISCTENLIWSQLPSCTCPVPALDTYLEMTEDCTHKNPNEHCLLRCLNGFNLQKYFITCQENMQWEPLPSCSSSVCQPPVLPEGVLQFEGDCTSKRFLDTCRLRCTGGGYSVGSDEIVCSENFIWTPLPSCTCPPPALNEYLETQDDCSRKNPNEYCLLKCRDGLTISKHYILCQMNTQWDTLPTCQMY